MTPVPGASSRRDVTVADGTEKEQSESIAGIPLNVDILS
jgi:hypothetical protein